MNIDELNDYFKIEVVRGSKEFVIENRYNKRGDFIGGGYSIHRDENAKEVSRTKWKPSGITLINQSNDVDYIKTMQGEIEERASKRMMVI